MAASLREVARRAGVSIKTVSNVVNNTGRVGADTRARVKQVIKELNYVPNLSARHLRRDRSGVIALAVPEITNPYFSELAALVVSEAAAHDWTVLIDETGAEPDRERLVLQGIRSHLIDGLLFIPRGIVAEDFALRTDRTPLVLLGERVTGVADRVAIDSYAAGRAATQHLLDLDRRRIALIGAGESVVEVSRGRFAGYRDALSEAGVAFDDLLAHGAMRSLQRCCPRIRRLHQRPAGRGPARVLRAGQPGRCGRGGGACRTR